MFKDDEEKIMTAPGICSDGSSCRHMFAPFVRAKKPGSHVKHLHWFHILLLAVLLAGRASCDETTLSVPSANAQTSVSYFLVVTVDVNGEKDESEITTWLRQVFQNQLQRCLPPNPEGTTTTPASPQTTPAGTSNETTTTVQRSNTTTAAAMTMLQSNNTTTAAAMTMLQSNNTTTAAAMTMLQSNNTTPATTFKRTTMITTATALKSSTTTRPVTGESITTTSPSTTTTTALKSRTATTPAARTTVKSTTATILPAVITQTPASGRGNRQTKTPNPSEPNRGRIVREIRDSVTQPSGISNVRTTGLFQDIEVSCNKTTAIRNTNCFVTLHLRRSVPSCCILRTLCAASKASSDIHVVGRTADRINPLQNECNSNIQRENRCIYTGQAGASCTEDGPAYMVPERNLTQCAAAKNNNTCSCSDYCSGTDAFYVFNISINDSMSVAHVSSLISELKKQPSCPSSAGVSCPSSIIATEYKAAKVNCGNTPTNLKRCRVILNFAHEVPICNVLAALMNLFESAEGVSYNGPVVRAAICGDLKENPLESEFATYSINLQPSTFCATIEETYILRCGNGINLLLLLQEQCEQELFTTPSPNVTTAQPNTTASVNVTSSPLNTTAQPNTTASVNVTSSPLNTTAQPNTTVSVNVTSSPLNTTTQPNTTVSVNVTSSPLNTTAQPNTTVSVNVTSSPLNTTTTTPKPNTTASVNVTSSPLNTTTQPNTTASVNVTSSPLNTTTTTPKPNTTASVTSSPASTTTLPTTATTISTTTAAANVTVSAESQADSLLKLTGDVSKLNSSQVDQLVSELENLLSGPTVSMELGNTSVHIVSNLLGAPPEVLSDSSNRIIGIVDTVGLKLTLDGKDATLLAPAVALSVKPVDGTNFKETVFSITDPTDVEVRGDPRLRRSVRKSIPQGSIRLPPTLTQDLTSEQQQLVSRVQFNFYQESTVYQDRSLGQRKLNSGILGASAANQSISELQDDVVIRLRNTEPVPANFVATCVFWDFTFNDGSGGWNPRGCHVLNTTDNETICGCNHLTSFAILLDLAREPLTSRLQATILTFITYIGCGISAIFLSITLLTYLAFGKLRKDIPSKILIQLCVALLLLNLVFLVDAWLALYPHAVGLCISTAWFLHYFLLVTFTWMGLEAVQMYLALVKVFNSYVSRYMVKLSLVGWGVPMIVVIIVIAIDKDNYGLVSYGRFADGTSDDFCWLKNDIAFYVSVVAYFGVIFLFNLAMFILVLVQLCRLKRQNPHNLQHRTTLQDVRSVAGITVLLGLTWGFAFFAWGPVNLAFMYLFAIFNSLQGFFIFVFYCAVKENVRKQWRTYLCCGRMRLAENSEWSRTATQKIGRRTSMNRLTSLQSSRSSQSNNSSSSSSYLVSDSAELINGIGSPFEDRTITADEEPRMDVVLNEINSQYRNQQAP